MINNNNFNLFDFWEQFDFFDRALNPNSFYAFLSKPGTTIEIYAYLSIFISILALIKVSSLIKENEGYSSYLRLVSLYNTSLQFFVCLFSFIVIYLDYRLSAKVPFFFNYWSSYFVTDGYVYITQGIISFCSILIAILMGSFFYRSRLLLLELPTFLNFCCVFILFLLSSFNLISLFISLEGLSFTLYILAASNSNSHGSIEAALKYFCIGSVSSGILLYGISLIYGLFGSLNLYQIQYLLTFNEWKYIGLTENTFMASTEMYTCLSIPFIFLIIGFLFKMSAAPFHFWTPDVYEGVQLPITAFFAIVVKLAIIFIFLKLFVLLPYIFRMEGILYLLNISTIASLFIGCFGALVQKKIKRFVAYASINQVGFLLMGFSYLGDSLFGLSSMLFHLSIYTIMSFGFFFLIANSYRGFGNLSNEFVYLSDFAGVAKKSPVLSVILTVLLFSMAGIPPLGGFFGKYFLLLSVVTTNNLSLAIYALFINVVSTFYYIQIVKNIWFGSSSTKFFFKVTNVSNLIVLIFCAVILVLVPFFAQSYLNACANLVNLIIYPLF